MNIISYKAQWKSEYFSDVLQREKEHNRAYRKAGKRLDDSAEIMNMNVIDKVIDNYTAAIHNKYGIELELIYAQGYRDCFALLRNLRLV